MEVETTQIILLDVGMLSLEETVWNLLHMKRFWHTRLFTSLETALLQLPFSAGIVMNEEGRLRTPSHISFIYLLEEIIRPPLLYWNATGG